MTRKSRPTVTRAATFQRYHANPTVPGTTDTGQKGHG